MNVEYMSWYQTGSTLMRCQACGALVVSGDTELHTNWHDKIERMELLLVRHENRLTFPENRVLGT